MSLGFCFPFRLGPLFALAVLGAGCGGQSNDNGANTAALDAGEVEDAPVSDTALLDGTVSCVMDPRVDTYTAGLTKMGAQGMAQIKITAAAPAPPAKGGNSWTIQILDASGQPLDATVTVDEKMPDHGHGTAVRPKITKGAGVGTYTLDPLYLFMAGVWRVQLGVVPAGTDGGLPLDTVTFYFCIEG